MSDSQPKLQVESPDIPGGPEAAAVIIRILKREAIDLDQTTFDDVFFTVLNSFIEQARQANFPDEDNPFIQIERELRAMLEHHAADALQGVPEAFHEDMRRFHHMTQEATRDLGLLVPAVKILENIAARTDREQYPLFWGNLHNELGSTYLELPVAARDKAIVKAIAALQLALEARPVETYPYEHAATLHNLGSAYLNSPLGDRADNLAKAVAAFQSAQRFITHEHPNDYAILQLNLGSALSLLPTGNRVLQLAQAEQHFVNAEDVFGEHYPPGWALVHTRWAQALHYGSPPDFKRAIKHYDQSLKFYGPDTARWDYIANTINKALAVLAKSPNTSGRAITHILLTPLEPWLAEQRPSQQHAQLMMAFGPYYNGQPRLPRLQQLRQAVAAENPPIEQAANYLQLICFDPVNAHQHLKTALDLLVVKG